MDTPDTLPPLPLHDAVRDELNQLQAGVDAAELHGALCGYLSGAGQLQRIDWLGQVMLDPDLPSPPREGALDALFVASAAQLSDPQMGFSLLLPDEDQAVNERAEALLAWCRGFLGGFGLSAGAEPPLSDEAAEALDDLGRIAASHISYDEPEADESALAEIEEFVRVATLLLYGDCHADRDRPRRVH